MKKLLMFVCAVMVAASAAHAAAPVTAGPRFYTKELTLSPVKSGRGNKDSTWVYLKPRTASATIPDTFYIDLTDAAFNSANYTSGVTKSGAQADTALDEVTASIRDSLAAFHLTFIVEGTVTDADSIAVSTAGQLATSAVGTPLVGSGSLNYVAIQNHANADWSTAGARTYSYSAVGQWYPMWDGKTTAGGPRAIAGLTLKRGVNRIRVIVTRNSDATTGDLIKYMARVVYPAVAK